MDFSIKTNFTDQFSKRPIKAFIAHPVKTVREYSDDPQSDWITVKCPAEEAEAYAVYAVVVEDCIDYEEWLFDVETNEQACQLKGLLYDLAGMRRPYLLTEQVLLEMKPGEEIGTGLILDPRLYNGCVRWLAVRGEGIHDWAIYYHHSTSDKEYVRWNGDKCLTPAVIKHLVPCDDKAFELYRK